MNKKIYMSAAALLLMSMAANAQIGKPYIHDPSTIMECDGKYYTFGTGGGGLISEDGWTWNSGAVRPGGGAAPDAIKIGDRYLIAYSATGGGLGGGHSGKVLTMWNKTLDPNSPDFEYTEPILVGWSEYDEDCDAIDAGLLMGPDGRLWCTYGTYFGFIRQIELDPKTGARMEGSEPVDVAIDCEATTMMYRNGWYYLLGTHGTCCDGVNSTYNIVVGRSRNPQGPFIDNVGRDMLRGGGKLVVGAEDRAMGAGHFGHFIDSEGVEKLSFHWEADLDQGGRSVLAIRPLVWRDDWPVAAEMVQTGTYEIESVRRGYALELEVDFQRMNVARVPRSGPGSEVEIGPIANQQLSEVIGSWPSGNIDVRANDYMSRPHQKWVLTPCPELGATISGPYFKITIAGTDRALAAAEGAELTTVPSFTGADEQLWRLDLLTDGTYKISPKAVPGTKEAYSLTSIGDSSVSLTKFDFSSDNCKWNLKARK